MKARIIKVCISTFLVLSVVLCANKAEAGTCKHNY